MPLRSGDSAGGFRLKRVQDVQDALQPRCVDGPVGIAVEVVANLQNPAETFERLRIPRMFAELRFKKGLAESRFGQPRETPAGLSCSNPRKLWV